MIEYSVNASQGHWIFGFAICFAWAFSKEKPSNGKNFSQYKQASKKKMYTTNDSISTECEWKFALKSYYIENNAELSKRWNYFYESIPWHTIWRK